MAISTRTVIPYLDLKAQYDSIRTEIDDAIRRVVERSQFVLGPEVEAFEQEFAAYCGTRHAVGVNSGTSALHLALLAAGIGPGDEVITSPFTFVATAATILWVGARPVYVDIEPDTLAMNPRLVEAAITPRTRAIMPVHLFGHPADMDPILEIGARRGLRVIEDAAQAVGAEYKGRRVGGLAEMGCFSFYPGKNLGAYGEGGCVVTNDEELARQIRLMRHWGQDRQYHYAVAGFNYRLEGLQAAVLRVKLRHLDDWTRQKRERAQTYIEALAGCGVGLPSEQSWAKHVYHVFAIQSERRDALRAALTELGVQTGIHYPEPVPFIGPYRDEAYAPGSLPVAEAVAARELSLPTYPEMPEETFDVVRRALQAGI